MEQMESQNYVEFSTEEYLAVTQNILHSILQSRLFEESQLMTFAHFLP